MALAATNWSNGADDVRSLLRVAPEKELPLHLLPACNVVGAPSKLQVGWEPFNCRCDRQRADLSDRGCSLNTAGMCLNRCCGGVFGASYSQYS